MLNRIHMHIFSEHYYLNFAKCHRSTTTFPCPFFGSVHVHMHPSQSFYPFVTRMCTPIQTALHLSHLLPSSLLGEMWSVLANTGHRDLWPHPSYSAWHSGTGYLLCQDLRSLQGKMTCAAECNAALHLSTICVYVLICLNIYAYRFVYLHLFLLPCHR